jgi:Flp pilus assembly protein TadD
MDRRVALAWGPALIRRCGGVCLLLVLAACASTPSAEVDAGPWHDEAFAAPAQPVRGDDVFALSDEMRHWLRTRGAEAMRRKGPQKGLLDALYAADGLRLRYDASHTRNAAEAFAARSGNCLSLVIMTAALARELGLQVEFHSAYADEVWSRSGDLVFRSGHVNVTLGRHLIDIGHGRSSDRTRWTIDFLPPEEISGLRTQPIDEADVLAMYFNNRAAELLARGAADEAYWWAREALRTRPGSAGARNTLGVIYLRQGLDASAEALFRAVLAREPRHTSALHNLALAVARQGRGEEARLLRARLAQLEPEPPYHFFDLGQAALRSGDVAAARDYFAKEVARAGHLAEFHHWLGVAHFRLGDIEAARRQLELARSLSATPNERALYAAKLAWIKEKSPP